MVDNTQNKQHSNKGRDGFHNPYNFVPTPAVIDKSKLEGLRQAEPLGHDRFYEDAWSGEIEVALTVETPLLIPGAELVPSENVGGKEHKTYPLRMIDGKPYLHPASFKGALRSAYEAITNSRMGVLEKHDERLAHRMNYREAQDMVPARISDDGKHYELLRGTGDSGVLDAAWLPFYGAQGKLQYSDGSYPKHGDKVKCRLQKIQYFKNTGRLVKFKYWRVINIAKDSESISGCDIQHVSTKKHKTLPETKEVQGYVFITNQNFGNKHDERVFFTTRQKPEKYELTDELQKAWKELICNCRETNAKVLQSRKKSEYREYKKQKAALSRHLWEGSNVLKAGDLCYARIEKEKILGLYPVMIGRELEKQAPIKLLDDTLHPATLIEHLSPADRVFGWVNQVENGAYKGQLSIGTICAGPYKTIRQKVTLKPLASPKPQQARFYVGDVEGNAQKSGISKKEAGYSAGKKLRGRKFYPHQQGWENSQVTTDEKSDQNYSVAEYIKPDSVFTAKINVMNLNDEEIGALLWLLSLNENQYFKMGGGKPLGFGSVHVSIASLKLKNGVSKKKEYSSLFAVEDDDTITDIDDTKVKHLITSYKDAIKSSYGNGKEFKDVSFIAAFLKAAEGYSDEEKTHYPYLENNPDKEHFKWFVQNEHQDGQKCSLPDMVSDGILPYYSGMKKYQGYENKKSRNHYKNDGSNHPSSNKNYRKK